jgi:hypothetical protein
MIKCFPKQRVGTEYPQVLSDETRLTFSLGGHLSWTNSLAWNRTSDNARPHYCVASIAPSPLLRLLGFRSRCLRHLSGRVDGYEACDGTVVCVPVVHGRAFHLDIDVGTYIWVHTYLQTMPCLQKTIGGGGPYIGILIIWVAPAQFLTTALILQFP